MLAVAILLFSLGAFFGAWMAIVLLQNNRPPRDVVYIHGGLVTSALAIVIYHTLTVDGPKPIASLVFFLLAALGGVVMYVMESAGVRPPRMAVVAHPLLAISGLILLLNFFMVMPH